MTSGDVRQVAKVALDLPAYAALHNLSEGGADLLFDYLCEQPVLIGQRVIVPFGHQRVIGLVAALGSSSLDLDKLKSVEAVLSDIDPLSQRWLDLVRFAANYYQRSLGEVALPALPTLLRRAPGYRLNKAGQLRSRSIEMLANKLEKFGHDSKQAGCSSAPALNLEQQAAADRIGAAMQSHGFAAFLLYGITGSGKTEVYLNALACVIKAKQQALVLVPEINLAPPLEALLKARFGSAAVASMHSGMTDAERAVNFLAAHTGRASILVGTRMAVLASLPELALIVVDEEHDASFKQQEGLRYSARDLAVLRASQASIPVVLGSATPSLESWHQAERGRYLLLRLSARATRHEALPEVHCITTRHVEKQHGFTPALKDAIAARLALGEQILVFVNRRGYAPVVHCGACGWVSDCPQCSAHAVFHKSDSRLHCHHCGWQARVPGKCPDCGNVDLAPIGRGTQRVEETLLEWFPDARIKRLDRDASQRKGEARALLESFHAGQIDILVGTQMLAKGHDFKNLTLVCVLGADSALYSADFRAPERLFANLSQVAGRAGRGEKKGVVLVQTEFPEHPLFEALKVHDFDGFARRLLAEREDAQLPPYTHQAMLRAESKSLAGSIEFLGRARVAMEHLSDDGTICIYDPVPMPLMRKANSERAQLLFESSERRALQRVLPELIKTLREFKWRGSWHVEVDPLEL